MKIKKFYSHTVEFNETHMRKYMAKTYDWDFERQIMSKIQKVQRNWDYEKYNERDQETQLDELLWVATNAPSKQYEGYYDLYYTNDRKVIEEISKYTWGNTHRRNPPSTWRNSQANASVYMIWVAKEPNTQKNSNADGTLKKNTHHERWLNAYVSIGISLGLTARAAAKMGYDTGFNKNHNDIDNNNFWEKKLGILEDVESGKKKIAYGLGIGYAQEERERWESDEKELMIGAANGSKITLTGQETHKRTGLPMRKAKIVNIEGKGNTKVKDPYGVDHIIPENADMKINSFNNRGIKITEIK
jgi:nitroreductase